MELLHPFLPLVTGLVFCIPGLGLLIKEPEIEVKDVTLASFDLSQIGINLALAIQNPNALGMTLKSVSFDVHYKNGEEWVFISHGERGKFEIKPGDNAVTIPLSIKTSEIPTALAGALLEGAITLKITGTARPDLLLIAPEIPFSKVKTLALTQG